ncbi:17482_t:CDS:2, partial [Gigaspora margarita]
MKLSGYANAFRDMLKIDYRKPIQQIGLFPPLKVSKYDFQYVQVI